MSSADSSAIGGKQKKTMVRPITVLEGLRQHKKRVVVWMQHDNNCRIEGTLAGYDELMNVIVEDATEINKKQGSSFPLGKTLIRADNIGLIHTIGS